MKSLPDDTNWPYKLGQKVLYFYIDEWIEVMYMGFDDSLNNKRPHTIYFKSKVSGSTFTAARNEQIKEPK